MSTGVIKNVGVITSHDKYSSYRGLVETAIKCDKLICHKSVDNNLKTNPLHFWKYVSSFRKNDKNYIELLIDGIRLTQT